MPGLTTNGHEAVSRKRSFEAIAGAGGKDARVDGDVDVAMVNKSRAAAVVSCGNGMVEKSPDRSDYAVRVDREDEDSHDSVYCEDESNGDEKDPPEIGDLRKALEYLVSERDIEQAYNGGKPPAKSKEPQSSSQSKSNIVVGANRLCQGKKKDDEELYKIPSLVNRILMEQYSPIMNQRVVNVSQNNASGKSAQPKNNMTRDQKEKMTQLLIAVIVEFAEPYFARMARHRQQEREKLLLIQQEQRKKKQNVEKRNGKKQQQPHTSIDNAPTQGNQNNSLLLEFDERATSWATSCLTQLLQPPPAPPRFPSGCEDIISSNNNFDKKNNDSSYSYDDDTHIPELDALLAASGPHDGMKMESRMQSALLHGMHGRRLLQNMGL